MRLLDLDLVAFGPFTNKEVHLDGDGADLHVIFGANEAGKSSALRGLRALLYGFPDRTTDDFVHDRTRLRVAGRLTAATGDDDTQKPVEVVRRKGRKNTLLAPNGSSLDDEVVAALCGGIDNERFDTMFGIGHDELARGSEEILAGGGAVGQSLFAASLGAAGLRELVARLDEQAAVLFKARGSKPIINMAISKYKKANKATRDLALSSHKWTQANKHLARLHEDRASLASALERQSAEHRRLDRLLQALPQLARRREITVSISGLEQRGVLILGVEFEQRHRDALHSEREGVAGQTKASGQRDRIREQLDQLQVPTELLAEEVAISALHRRLGGHQKALQDVIGLRAKRGQLRAAAHRVLDELDMGVELDAVEEIRPNAAVKARVRELAQQHQAVHEAADQSTREVDKLTGLRGDTLTKLNDLAPPRDFGGLRSALERQLRRGDLEDVRAEAQRSHDLAQESAAVGLAALNLWTGTVGEAEKLAVPAPETIERFRDTFEALVQADEGLAGEHLKANAGVADIDQQLEALRQSGEVPTETELGSRRDDRSKGWRLVRRAWLEGDDVTADALLFDGDRDLPTALEYRVEQADDLADRLRREADRVATKASLEAQKARLLSHIDDLHLQRERLAPKRQQADDKWAATWAPLAITPLPPREMSAWLTRHAHLATAAASVRETAAHVRTLDADITAVRDDFGTRLSILGEPTPKDAETLASLLDRSRGITAAAEELERERRQLDERGAELERDLKDARERAESAQQALQQWRVHWHTAIAGLGLDADASPAQANAVLDKITELFAATDDARGLDFRIRAISKDADAFDAEVGDLVARVASDLVGRPHDQAAEELQKRLNSAKAAQMKAEGLQEKWEEADSDLTNANEVIAAAARELAALCVIAGCESPTELPAAEEASAERSGLQQELDTIDAQLVATGSGATVADLIDQTEDVDADTLPARIEELQLACEQLEATRTELDQDIGGARRELDSLDGSEAAAVEAERAYGLLAEVRSHVERYIRVRLAGELLRREIERYREENQGPVLRRAHELFQTLTLGSFAGVSTSFDANDEPVIVGVRASGEEVGVAGMSDGTRDQLYLSIRLATLERYFDAHGPFPFVVDDVFIRFDDQRSLAGLKVLAELARKTQVLFFTHHQRMVELARNVGPQAAQFHEL